METFLVGIGMVIFVVLFLLAIILMIWALKRYYRVNDELAREVEKHLRMKKFDNYPVFYLKSRGWGLSFLNIPGGLGVGGAQQTASVEMKKDTIVLTWIKREEISYSKIKKVDAFNLGCLGKILVFHFNNSPYTKYGNIVDKSLMINVLKILKTKGVKLTKRAEKKIK